MINDLLQNKSAKEKAQIKVTEIAKFNHVGKFIEGDLEIEIQSLSVIEVNGQHGIEFFARAWKNGKQLGFSDGSIEIERFRVFNPPVLVYDPNGDIIRTSTIEGVTTTIKLREDPIEAIRQDLVHTIGLVGKDSGKVILGKVGNTTSTFYPDADPESTSVDGWVFRAAANESWNTIRTTTTGTGSSDNNNFVNFQVALSNDSGGTNWRNMRRIIVLFDTSALPDTDTISSATLSLYASLVSAANWGQSIAINTSNPASNTAIADGDYDYGDFGTTDLATRVLGSNITVDQYNDFALNASGLANITKTGVSKFGLRYSGDVDNAEPSNSAGQKDDTNAFLHADTAGTASDPKLVVVHSAAGGAANHWLLMGV